VGNGEGRKEGEGIKRTYLELIWKNAEEGLKVMGRAILRGVGGEIDFNGQYFSIVLEICGIHSIIKFPLM
jgi:hypothetical protein